MQRFSRDSFPKIQTRSCSPALLCISRLSPVAVEPAALAAAADLAPDGSSWLRLCLNHFREIFGPSEARLTLRALHLKRPQPTNQKVGSPDVGEVAFNRVTSRGTTPTAGEKFAVEPGRTENTVVA